jgi:predicted ATPase/class 3 adenylate cyclase
VQAGTFTFLFTDIESSTQQWEADAEAMSAALAHHDDVVRSAVAAAGGDIFKHTGDGICAVFPSAAAGVAGAFAAQQGLTGGPLRVRMAVHTGAAETRGGDFFGPTLNRAARMMDAAWGGQLLVSAAAAQLAGEILPAGADLIDLGEHHLADLARVERIFQVRGPGLDPAFPPLRTVSARRHNLPVALTRFVGREDELTRLAALLKESRLISVVGVGGAGKTRLATEAAARALPDFPDGVFIAELAAVVDPNQVAASVASALGALLGGAERLDEKLAAYLERRRTLLVLDNCEHAIEAAATLAETIVRTAGHVVVLATSREPLGVPGEAVWRIPPLGGADALDLLCDRARGAQPDFTPSHTDTPALERICARLDGLPLAIELAAARLHLLSAAEIAARLDDRFRLLTGGARTAVDRHRTLRATIDWGYDLLGLSSQTLLRRLSVFSGGFDLPAAEAVGGPDALDLLGGLVDRSWVAVDAPGPGPRRYHMIETIRQYASEKLAEAGEAIEARQAHGDHFLALAREGDRFIRHDLSWMRAARTDLDNFRTAIEWAESRLDGAAAIDIAVALAPSLTLGDRPGESVGWVRRALAVSAGQPAAVRLRGLCYLAFALATNEARPEARREAGVAASEALALARRESDRRYQDIATMIVAQLAAMDSDTAGASPAPIGEAYEALLVSDRHVALWAAQNLAWVAVSQEDVAQAEGWFNEALRLARDTDSIMGDCHASAALARLAAARGDIDAAFRLADRAVALSRQVEFRLLRVMALVRLAETAILLGRSGRAVEALSESLPLLRDTGSRHWASHSLELAAVVAAHREHFVEAARLLGAARAHDDLTGQTNRLQAPGAGFARMRSRQALGQEAYTAESATGGAMAVDVALAFALGAVSR